MNDNLNNFEEEIMNMLLAGEDAVLSILQNQFKHAVVQSRKLTGVGFFLFFHIPEEIPRVSELSPFTRPNFCFGDVDATIAGLHNGAGFLIWVKDGYLKQLEGYTYGEQWPSQMKDYKLHYRGGSRSIADLRRKWAVEKT